MTRTKVGSQRVKYFVAADHASQAALSALCARDLVTSGLTRDFPPTGVDMGRGKHLTALVGESDVILNCPLNFPEGKPVPYVIEWKKQVSTLR